jgi:hypothetical protein
MENTATFSCRVGTTDESATLGLEIWLDDRQIFDTTHVNSTVECQTTFSDAAGEHELRFVMKNKTGDQTQIDAAGNILKDACLTISNVAFEEMDLGHLFVEQATYIHDFNGTQEEITDQCYGAMGCNGTVSLRFTTPIYLWLLENM